MFGRKEVSDVKVMGFSLSSSLTVFTLLKTDSCVFHTLFILTIFVNKYVLSVLGFTYPTVYQGWQTLVGAFILLYLRPNLLAVNDESNKLTCLHFLRILPSLLIYVASIICGSKALASVPVPLFLCAQNASSLCFLLCTLKQVLFFDLIIGFTGLLSSLLIFFYIGYFEEYGYHPWPIFYIIVLTILELVNASSDGNSEVSRLYYRNIFSFIFLMPCSLYLGEAFSALQFKYLDQIGFYAGCVVSGLCGIFFQLSSLKLSRWRQNHWLSSLARLPTLLISLFIFDNSSIPDPLWVVIGVQIISTVIFTHSILSSDLKLSNSQENII